MIEWLPNLERESGDQKLKICIKPVSVSEKCEKIGALLRLSSLCSSREEHLWKKDK